MVLDWEAAREMVVNKCRMAGRRSSAPLGEAYGRILAADVYADRDIPAVRRSLRDGFAVRCADLPGKLKIRAETKAGDVEAAPLQPGEAQEIMTGAPVPHEADAVVMVEHVTVCDGSVNVDRAAEPGQWINERAAEAKQGSVLLRQGTRIDASAIAILAMTGTVKVPVYSKSAVAILSTGDEIVDVDQTPAHHQIRNSNSYMLAALCSAIGAAPIVHPTVPDTREALGQALQGALHTDAVVISGGVSAGRYDLVKPGLRDMGAQIHFERVRIQPGGPFTFATVGSKPVFCLPGNPASAHVTFQLFVQPALEVISGGDTKPMRFSYARLSKPFKHAGNLTKFLPAYIERDVATHIPWRGSSDIPALARANAFLIADRERLEWKEGEFIPVMKKL